MKIRTRSRIQSALVTAFALVAYAQVAEAQCVAPTLSFHSPVLLSGTDGQVGAIYLFPEVGPGLDAHIEITGLVGGATLNNIDDTAGVGYYHAFQPYVGAGANDTSYLDWRITFKKGGTNEDSVLQCLAVTGVDVDGDNANLKEFIEAATPGSFAVDPATNLQVSFDGVRSKAISPVANIPLIDTSHLEAMFQMNFVNISTLDYRNGAITTAGAQVRQTCIYFKPFFDNYIMLPNKLLSFTATTIKNTVAVKWTTTDEEDMQGYILQRSIDGRTWMNIGTIPAQRSAGKNDYVVHDFSDLSRNTYFRLMQVQKTGARKASGIVKVTAKSSDEIDFVHNTVFSDKISLRLSNLGSGNLQYTVYSFSGQIITHKRQLASHGLSNLIIPMADTVRPGSYVLVVRNDQGEQLYQSKLIKLH